MNEMLRQPPYSAEAEQYLLGALLLNNDSFDSVSWLTAEQFYADRHRRLFAAIQSMIESGKAADSFTVCEELGSNLEKAGGAAYIAQLAQNVPSATNLRRYGEIVRDKAILRDLIKRAEEVAELAYSGSSPPKDVAEEAESKFMSVMDNGAMAADVVPVGKALAEYLEWVEDHPKGIETGLKDLDAITGGLLPGNLVVIAGRPHMGKTAAALQIAEHICQKTPGVMFSLESSRREIAGRLIEWHRHQGRDKAADKVFNLRLFVDDTSDVSPGLIRSKVRRLRRQNGCGVIVVDYLQLMRGRGDSRQEEVSYVSRQLKAIAKEFQIPVIALAQLNRDVEKRVDKKPAMADLRESGSIEADADLILLLYRPDYYDTKIDSPVTEAEIIVAKNRNNGRTGLVKVMFGKELGRFGDFIPERYRSGVA